MAYLHCHSCHWSQDDFWEWRIKWAKLLNWKYRPFGYNPLSLVLEDIASYYKPRYIDFEQWFADENGFKSRNIFSWHIMLWSIKNHIKRLFTQTWWTYKSWRKDKDKAVCPNCGEVDFDID